jgi:hypothetical protein
VAEAASGWKMLSTFFKSSRDVDIHSALQTTSALTSPLQTIPIAPLVALDTICNGRISRQRAWKKANTSGLSGYSFFGGYHLYGSPSVQLKKRQAKFDSPSGRPYTAYSLKDLKPIHP